MPKTNLERVSEAAHPTSGIPILTTDYTFSVKHPLYSIPISIVRPRCCADQALFDVTDPTKLIEQLDMPFFVPEADFEKSGQYPAGTVFIEELVYYQDKWFLYYGCVDSRVAVAIYNPQK